MSKRIASFSLSVKIFDVFGKPIAEKPVRDLLTISETDVDRLLRVADNQLGNCRISNAYGKKYYDKNDPNAYKIDCILFASNQDCLNELNEYAEDKFDLLDDTYKIDLNEKDEWTRLRYCEIVKECGSRVNELIFKLPESIEVETLPKKYDSHLYINNNGEYFADLNGWEEKILFEEMGKPDFICWIRNIPLAKWALCLPYHISGETKSFFPDFIIVRKNNKATPEYLVDILEPHSPAYKDNLAKARSLAEYAKDEPRMGRIQLIRSAEDSAKGFVRLDMQNSKTRKRVLDAKNNDELDAIFDECGVS